MSFAIASLLVRKGSASMEDGLGGMNRSFVLINSNVVRPPVNPLGLEYVGEALIRGGMAVELVDLSWEKDWQSALATALSRQEPLAVGVTFRNIDDCSSVTRVSFVPGLTELVHEVRRHTPAPVVLGGVGFSIAPAPIMKTSGVDYGIAGDGEEAALKLARCLEHGESPVNIPNLVHWDDRRLVCNPRTGADLVNVPVPSRSLFDNPRYQAEGAMVGIETKRGCPEQCIYCADPLAKGAKLRLRPPKAVAEEMENLVRQGVWWYHLCDSEFNIPLDHAKEVCRAILSCGLGGRVRWYTYCSPVPFDAELAELMLRSGCAGINFGVDSLCDEQLERLGRRHRIGDIENLVSLLQKAGLNFMFDLLVGGPGETDETLHGTAEVSRRLDLPLVGVAMGVRVYPGTLLAGMLAREDGGITKRIGNLLEPDFYFSPTLGEDPVSAVRECLGDDPRFLLLAGPADERNYNYVDDSWLSDAIASGARGAYWDIIRRGRASDAVGA
jgi:hypothetical protein